MQPATTGKRARVIYAVAESQELARDVMYRRPGLVVLGRQLCTLESWPKRLIQADSFLRNLWKSQEWLRNLMSRGCGTGIPWLRKRSFRFSMMSYAPSRPGASNRSGVATPSSRRHWFTRHSSSSSSPVGRRNEGQSQAPARIVLDDTGNPPHDLIGFSELETGLVLLTHPLRGFYFRRDGRLGSYSIWHDKLQPTEGHARSASFPLLHELGLVEDADLSTIHSVLIQREIDFTIYLPPTAL